MKNETIRDEMKLNKTYDEIIQEKDRSRNERNDPTDVKCKKKSRLYSIIGESLAIGTLTMAAMYFGATHSHQILSCADKVKSYTDDTIKSIEDFFQPGGAEQSSQLNKTYVNTSVYGGKK